MKNYKKIVKRAFGKWAKGDQDFYTLLASDVQWINTGTGPVSKVYDGRKMLMSEFVDPFHSRLKNIGPVLSRVYADGKTVIVLWTAEGVAADGEEYHNTYSWILTFRRKKIIEVTAFFDTVSVVELFDRISVASTMDI